LCSPDDAPHVKAGELDLLDALPLSSNWKSLVLPLGDGDDNVLAGEPDGPTTGDQLDLASLLSSLLLLSLLPGSSSFSIGLASFLAPQTEPTGNFSSSFTAAGCGCITLTALVLRILRSLGAGDFSRGASCGFFNDFSGIGDFSRASFGLFHTLPASKDLFVIFVAFVSVLASLSGRPLPAGGAGDGEGVGPAVLFTLLFGETGSDLEIGGAAFWPHVLVAGRPPKPVDAFATGGFLPHTEPAGNDLDMISASSTLDRLLALI